MFLLTKYWIAPCAQRFALGRGRNAHFRAVLGDGAAADLDAESRERQTKRLVRERRGRVLCANEALQPLLDRVGRDCRVGADRRGEKAAHGDDPALELNVFILRRTAHGGGADAHFFGKLLHRHGQQCLAATEKPCCSRPMSVSICMSVSQRVWTPLMRACASESFSFT